MQNIENIAINFAPWDDAGCSNKYQILFWSSENLCLGKTSWSCPSKDSSSKTSLSIRYFFENLKLEKFLSTKVKPGDNISQGAFHQSARSPTLPWRRYDSRQLDRGYWRKMTINLTECFATCHVESPSLVECEDIREVSGPSLKVIFIQEGVKLICDPQNSDRASIESKTTFRR